MYVERELNNLMEKWAAEQKRKQDGGLGYGQSVLAGAGEGRSVVAHALPRGVHDLAGAFVVVDKVLADANPLVAAAVKAQYLWGGSDTQKAQRLGISRTTLWRRIKDGMEALQNAWLFGYEQRKTFHAIAA